MRRWHAGFGWDVRNCIWPCASAECPLCTCGCNPQVKRNCVFLTLHLQCGDTEVMLSEVRPCTNIPWKLRCIRRTCSPLADTVNCDHMHARKRNPAVGRCCTRYSFPEISQLVSLIDVDAHCWVHSPLGVLSAPGGQQRQAHQQHVQSHSWCIPTKTQTCMYLPEALDVFV